MQVTVVPSYRNTSEFTVKVAQGVQSFTLDYQGSREECRWYAKMFRTALRAHREPEGGKESLGLPCPS